MSINIAIDGPAGAGKSTIARAAAKRLGFLYADTGALYRTVALFCSRRGLTDANEIQAALPEANIALRFEADGQRVLLNGEDVSELIRTPEISMAASQVSAIGAVRDYLFALQQQLAARENILMDGRDIGTVVLPHADLKIFLTADAAERARRRYAELAAKPDCPSYEAVLADIVQRDEQDRTRAVAPLRQAEDAVLLDTTQLSPKESVDAVLRLCAERLGLTCTT